MWVFHASLGFLGALHSSLMRVVQQYGSSKQHSAYAFSTISPRALEPKP